MAIVDLIEDAKRAAIRATAGAALRAKLARADQTERMAELFSLRAETLAPLDVPDFERAAREIGCRPATIHAIANAESAGQGFDPAGRLIILAEPHVFSQLTFRAFDTRHPDLVYPTWVPYSRTGAPPGAFRRHPYALDQDGRWDLVATWAQLDLDAAIGSFSAGRFQQLIGSTKPDRGWKLLRMASAEALYRKLARSEADQLEVLQLFFTANGAGRALRDNNWQTIARIYNGPGQVAKYSAVLAAEHQRVARHYA